MAEGQAIPVPAGVTMQQDQPQSGAVPVPAGVSAQPEGAIPVPAGVTVAPEEVSTTPAPKTPQEIQDEQDNALTAEDYEKLSPQDKAAFDQRQRFKNIQHVKDIASNFTKGAEQTSTFVGGLIHKLPLVGGIVPESGLKAEDIQSKQLSGNTVDKVVGLGLEQVAEYMLVSELGGAGFKALSESDKIAQIAKYTKMLEKSPTLFKAMKASLQGVEDYKTANPRTYRMIAGLLHNFGVVAPGLTVQGIAHGSDFKTAAKQGLMGAGIGSGLQGLAEGAGASIDATRQALSPQVQEVGGKMIPVQNKSLLARLARTSLPEGAVKSFTENITEPEVRKGIGEVLQQPTPSEITVEPTRRDPMGIKKVAEDLIDNHARPVWQYIDTLSNGKMTEVQNEIKVARAAHDAEALDAAYEKKDALLDNFRDDLKQAGLDPDAAERVYRQGKGLERISRIFDRQSITSAGEHGGELFTNGKNLRNAIEEILKKPRMLEDVGLDADHVQQLTELSQALKDQQVAAKLPTVVKYLGRAAATLLTSHVGGGIPGLMAEMAGEQGIPYLGEKIFGDLMLSDPRAINGALTGTDILKAAEEAVAGQAAKQGDGWISGLKSTLVDDIKEMFSGSQKGQRGSMSLRKIKKPVADAIAAASPQQVKELKDLGMTEAEINEALKVAGKVATTGGEEIAPTGGHAGGGVVSSEELGRAGTHYGVNKSGEVTNFGKAYNPENYPESGERGAHVTMLPDGSMRLNGGVITPKMEEAVRRVHANVTSPEVTAPEVTPTLTRQEALAAPAATAEAGISPEEAARREGLAQHEVATRRPSSKKALENYVHNPDDMSNYDAMFEASKSPRSGNAPYVESVLGHMAKSNYPGFERYGIAEMEPRKGMDTMVDHMVRNVKYLYNKMPKGFRDLAENWYPGGNQLLNKWSKTYGYSMPQTAGVTAVLSPNNPWENNIGLAQRFLDISKNHTNVPMTPEMERWIPKLKEAYSSVKGADKWLDEIAGKSLAEVRASEPNKYIRSVKSAMWMRMYDEAMTKAGNELPKGVTGIPNYDYSPTGEIIGVNKNRRSWIGLSHLSKAAYILENDLSPAELSEIIGEGHKVRNFYNNLVNPWSTRGGSTIDTHQINAHLMRALKQEAPEVKANFGGVASHGDTGLSGTYPIHDEVLRRAAKDLGIKDPRALQSISWEGIRSLIPTTMKKNPEIAKSIDQIWKAFDEGQFSQEEALDRIYNLVGGFKKPAWMKSAQWEQILADDAKAKGLTAEPKGGTMQAVAGLGDDVAAAVKPIKKAGKERK